MPFPKKQTPVRAGAKTFPVASDSEKDSGIGPDVEGLREFAEKSDRQAPPEFVGRSGLIEGLSKDLRTRTKDWMAGESDAWEGAIWLFQGAPGAGKTALLRHLKKLLINGEPVRVCMPEKIALNDPAELKKHIAEAFSLAGTLKEDWLKRMETGQKNVGGKLDIGIPGGRKSAQGVPARSEKARRPLGGTSGKRRGDIPPSC